jgi:agmatinase
MSSLTQFDPNSAGNPDNNIFGLPFTEEESRLVIVPVPWEVTVSYHAGTARSADHISRAALQVDLFDPEMPDLWKQGFYMRPVDKKLLMKSDYLRKEAELYIAYISKGDAVEKNSFMCKSLKDINDGSDFMNAWVYDQTSTLLKQGKLVALLGGDHSTPLGFFKAIGEKYGSFGILQIDAHFDLREAYEGFKYSHASIMYNALQEVPAIEKLVQVGIRDYCDEEYLYMQNSQGRVVTFFDKDLKERSYEGELWKNIVQEIVETLPQQVFLSFDIDGLDRKYCPHTGTPVQGGLETDQVFYLIKKILQSGRKLIGFDLNEVGIGESEWDANVGARVLYKLCNFLVHSNPA